MNESDPIADQNMQPVPPSGELNADNEDTSATSSMPTTPTQPHVAHLLLEFIFKYRWFLGLARRFLPIQGKHMHFGIRVTNLGPVPFDGGVLRDLRIKYLGSDLAVETYFEKQVSPLGPKKSTNVWVANTMCMAHGAIHISCTIVSSVPGVTIKTYQCSPGHDNYTLLKHAGHWEDANYVQPRFEFLQSRTNMLVLLLTLVTVIDSKVFNIALAFLARLFARLGKWMW